MAGEQLVGLNGSPQLAAIEWLATELALPDGLSFDDWSSLGEVLARMDKSVMWWIGDWWHYGEHAYGERTSQVADQDRFSFQTYADAGWVAGRIETSRRREVLSFSHHREVAGLEPADQEKWLVRAETDDLTRNELRRQIKRSRLITTGTAQGTYRVIYADPPWNYGDDLIEGYGPADHHYPSLPTSELCELAPDGKRVEEMAEDDAVLFLWATSPLLPDAFTVISAWGFTYKASFVWDKVQHNYGHYNSVRHELLLIATRGSCLPETNKLHDSVVSLARSEHSAKPDLFRDLIGELYPSGRRVELFARTEPEGWDTWGAT